MTLQTQLDQVEKDAEFWPDWKRRECGLPQTANHKRPATARENLVRSAAELSAKLKRLATARENLVRAEAEMPAKLERLEQAARKPSAATMQLELV